MVNGIPSYYGGSVYTQFASPGKIDNYTLKYIKLALFENQEIEIQSSPMHCEYAITDWNKPDTLSQERQFIQNAGWNWDGKLSVNGIGWGGCLESIDDILRHGTEMPTVEDFKNVVLVLETSEEKPTPEYVARVVRGLGGRGF